MTLELPPISKKELEYNAYKERVYTYEAEIIDKQNQRDFYAERCAGLEPEVLLEIAERERIAQLIKKSKDFNYI